MHCKDSYKEIMEKLIIGSLRLKEKGIEVYDHSDLAIVLFKLNNNMKYYANRFACIENVRNGKLTLVTTEIDNSIYFRIVIMDPNFIDYYHDFVEKFIEEYEFYTNDFDDYISIKVDNLLEIAQECDTNDELIELIKSGKKFTAYNGFEPSGRIHIAQAITTVLNTNEIIRNGGNMIIYIADWFAQMNHKMGGDLDKIKLVGKYFIEVFKACGINLSGTRFIWASDFINESKTYFQRVLDISLNTTLKRNLKCTQIMGRSEGDALSTSQLFYPCMQCADIFELGVDVCQLGIDQKKVNMLARDYASRKGIKPPIILSHHMLMGLKGPSVKMSKSDPNGAIFVEDTEEDVIKKIRKSYCPDSPVDNPIFEYIKYILMRWFHVLDLREKTYTNIDEIEKDFELMDKKELKDKVAYYINKILEPIREHFSKNGLKELLEQVVSFRVTR